MPKHEETGARIGESVDGGPAARPATKIKFIEDAQAVEKRL
jgi:hypothetical protein